MASGSSQRRPVRVLRFGVIDDELDHRGNGNGQGDWLRVAQPEPCRPVAKRCPVAAYRVFGLTLGNERPNRVLRHRPKLLGIQGRDMAQPIDTAIGHLDFRCIVRASL
jgi:hypothetical protein